MHNFSIRQCCEWKLRIHDNTRQWKMILYSSKCFYQNYFIRIECFEYLIWDLFFFDNELQMVLQNTHMRVFFETQQYKNIAIFFSFSSVVKFFSFYFVFLWIARKKTELPINLYSSIEIWTRQHVFTHRMYRISQYWFFTHFCKWNKKEHITVDSIIISQSSPFLFHSPNPILHVYRFISVRFVS